MDINNPFKPITIYETESESEHASDSDDEQQQSEGSDIENTHSQRSTTAQPGLEQLMKDSIGATGHNILLGSLKKKGNLAAKDCGATLAWKPGKNGSKKLKGRDLERFKSKKSDKLSICQMVRAGSHLQQMRVFQDTTGVHLNSYQDYVEHSSDIVHHICWILTHEALMENVDHGDMLDYFNKRFADLRNRRNYDFK